MTLLGLDTSRWEDNPVTPQTIDWQAAKDNGAAFVILKATEGPSYVDPVFKLHAEKSKGILPRGSYHFWRYPVSARAQALSYANVAKGLELPPVLDVEDWYGEFPKGTVLLNALIAMLKEVDAAFGVECMIYTSPNILKYYLPAVLPVEITKRRLWIAHYGVTQPDTRPINRYTFWQFSDRGDAAKYGITEAEGVDLNWYPGSQADFNHEFGLGEVVHPMPFVVINSVTSGGVLIPDILKVSVTVDSQTQVIEIDQRIQTIPVPPVVSGLYRIKDDIQRGCPPRPADRRTGKMRNGLPSTIRMQGGASSVRLTPEWMAYIYSIQGNPNYQFVSKSTLKNAVGWHNQGEANRVEQVVFSGNIVEVLRIEGEKAYIKTVCVTDAPPSVKVTPMTGDHPLIHNFSIQYPGRCDITTDGKYARIIVMSNPGESLWIDIGELTKL